MIIIPILIIALALVAIVAIGGMIVSHFPVRLGLRPVGPGDHWIRRDKERREEPVYDRVAATTDRIVSHL